MLEKEIIRNPYGSRARPIDMREMDLYTGGMAEQVVRDAVDDLWNDARFAEEVRKGFDSLDRGEFVEHDEVGTRLTDCYRRNADPVVDGN